MFTVCASPLYRIIVMPFSPNANSKSLNGFAPREKEIAKKTQTNAAISMRNEQ
jgi:hypothetical protein